MNTGIRADDLPLLTQITVPQSHQNLLTYDRFDQFSSRNIGIVSIKTLSLLMLPI